MPLAELGQQGEKPRRHGVQQWLGKMREVQAVAMAAVRACAALMMYRSILVPVDQTPFSVGALPWAVALAQSGRVAVHLVQVTEPVVVATVADHVLPPPVSTRAERAAALLSLEEIAEVVRSATNSEIVASVEEGDAATALEQYMERHGIDLTVMATHARGLVGRLLAGSVADRFVRHSAQPVLLVPPEAQKKAAVKRVDVEHVLVPLDGSSLAESAIPHAVAVCELTGARCTLLTVQVPTLVSGIAAPTALVDRHGEGSARAELAAYLERCAQPFYDQAIRVTTEVTKAREAATGIREAVDARRVDLIVMASHRRGGIARAAMGSTATSLLTTSAVPQLVVRSSHEAD